MYSNTLEQIVLNVIFLMNNSVFQEDGNGGISCKKFHVKMQILTVTLKVIFPNLTQTVIIKNGLKKITIKIPVHKTLTVVHGRLSVKEIRTLFKVWLFWFGFMVCNATFNNISVISQRSVLLVEETGVLGENHQPLASH